MFAGILAEFTNGVKLFASLVWKTYPSRHTMSFQRLIDVEATSCVYWVLQLLLLLLISKMKTNAAKVFGLIIHRRPPDLPYAIIETR